MSVAINPSIPYKLGWLPDVPDARDIPFQAVFRVPSKLPARVDLRGAFSPVEQQGELGSCTAQALVGCLEFLELQAVNSKLKNRKPARNATHPTATLERSDCGLGSVAGGSAIATSPSSGASGHLAPGADVEKSFRDLSRLFVYYNERKTMGTVREDSGAMLRTGIKVLKKLGVCRELLWPYAIDKFTLKPKSECYAEAARHQVTAYQRLRTLREMKACLAMGLPFVFGFAVYEHAMSAEVRRSGAVRLPGPHERMIGGHAVAASGYDDAKKVLYFRNSWGAEWGRSGYGTLPYAYPESRDLSDDFWCIQATESNLYARWMINAGCALS